MRDATQQPRPETPAPVTGPPAHLSSLVPGPTAGRVFTVSLVMALALLGDSLLYVVLPLHGAVLGLSGFQVGVLLSANRFVRMATNTGAARLMRRLRPGPLFTAATVLAAATTAFYTLTPAFVPFLVARLAWGLSFSALRLGCFITVLAAATDRTRGRLMGAYQSISRAGSFTAVMAGGALFDAFGYRTAVLVMATGTALALPLAAWKGPERGKRQEARGKREEISTGMGQGDDRLTDDPPTTTSSLRVVRPHPLLSSLPASLLPSPSSLAAVKWSAFALSFVGRGVVTATLALFLRRAFGEHFGPGGAIGVATVASWLIGVRWASEIGLAAPLGALSDRVGRSRAAIGWLLAATAAVLALALAPTLGVAVAASAALFVAASGLGATLDAAAGDLAPLRRRAEVMSSYADWADMGAALGPLLALTFADSLGLRPSYVLGALLLAAGAAVMALAFREGARPAAARGGPPAASPVGPRVNREGTEDGAEQ